MTLPASPDSAEARCAYEIVSAHDGSVVCCNPKDHEIHTKPGRYWFHAFVPMPAEEKPLAPASRAPPDPDEWLPMKSREAFEWWLKTSGATTMIEAWDAGRLHYIARVKIAAEAIQSKTIASLLRDGMAMQDKAEELP